MWTLIMSSLRKLIDAFDFTLPDGKWASQGEYELDSMDHDIRTSTGKFRLVEKQEVTRYTFIWSGECYAIESSKYGLNWRSLRRVEQEVIDMGEGKDPLVVYNEIDDYE